MLTKRIIPCLDIKDGRTVKGVNFENIRDAGDPIELAKLYVQQKADELVFLDITATHEKRKTLVSLVDQIAQEINIPFTVGGGINELELVSEIVHAGADKVTINSAAVKNPQLIKDIAQSYGSQFVVVAIDAKEIQGEWYVFLNGGRVNTEIKLLDWVKKCQDFGAGEILFTSMNHDGTKNGFAIDILSQVNEKIEIPLIASGGAGNMQHFVDVFKETGVDAALAASIFHFKEVEIGDLKQNLSEQRIPVRL